jgi:hypothetical protein
MSLAQITRDETSAYPPRKLRNADGYTSLGAGSDHFFGGHEWWVGTHGPSISPTHLQVNPKSPVRDEFRVNLQLYAKTVVRARSIALRAIWKCVLM